MSQNAIKPGSFVIVRARGAGVHAGIYQGHNGQEVKLTKARRLWQWWAAQSITLSGVAQFGLNHKKSRIGAPVDEAVILDACEILTTTDAAATSIAEAPVADAA